MDAVPFARLLQIVNTIGELRREEREDAWSQAAFPAYIAWAMQADKDVRMRSGIDSFRDFLDVYGIKPIDPEEEREEREEDIARAYEDVASFFGPAAAARTRERLLEPEMHAQTQPPPSSRPGPSREVPPNGARANGFNANGPQGWPGKKRG